MIRKSKQNIMMMLEVLYGVRGVYIANGAVFHLSGMH